MPLHRPLLLLGISAILLLTPKVALAQGEDTTVWQQTGREAYREWAQRDSAVARTLFRNLHRRDYRFLNVPDYGDGAIGMYTPAHDSALARYGVRMYADSDLTDESVRAQRYYEPYHFAEHYNQALFAFVGAPDSAQRCYLAQTTPFGGCYWTPLPQEDTPPPERRLAAVDSTTLEAMLDAALASALSRGESGGPVALNAEFGWDGIYSLARKGSHPTAWLARVLQRHLVACIPGLVTSPPCPTTGPLTTIALNQPRALDDTTIVIYTTIRTVMKQEAPPHTCGFGCFFGVDYEAHLVRDGTGFRAEAEMMMYLN